MIKGIARLGIIGFVSLFASLCFALPCYASSVSDLLISEIMANPAGVSDTRGEWFELYNPTIEPINLRGIDLGDDGGNRHRFDTDLLIMPSEFLTLARSADPGFAPDYVYDNFTLANSDDEIVFRDGLLELLRLDYDSGFTQAGVSRELQQLPMLASNYGLTLASLSYGAGDIGTPGVAGGPLLTPSAVPIPAAAWLFLSGVLAIVSPTALRKVRAAYVIATNPAILKIPVIPIRRTAAQAGISQRPKVSTSRITLSPHKSLDLQS
jgi:hypothetical protein